jgi:hypothetical protein
MLQQQIALMQLQLLQFITAKQLLMGAHGGTIV